MRTNGVRSGALALLVALAASAAATADLPELRTGVLRTFAEGNPVALTWATVYQPRQATRLFVLDGMAATVSRYGEQGELEARFGGPGTGPGELAFPSSISADHAGAIYIADTGNDRIQVFDWDGKHLRSIGRSGAEPGELRDPRAVLVDSHLDRAPLAVADTGNDRIQLFTLGGRFVEQLPVDSPTALAYATYAGLVIASADLGTLRTFSPSTSPRLAKAFLPAALLRKQGHLALPSAIDEGEEKILLGDAERARVLVLSERWELQGKVSLDAPARSVAWGRRREIPSILVADGRRVVELGFEIDSPVPVWLRMVDALEKRDIEGALEHIHPAQRALFREIYTDIEQDLPAEAKGMRDVVVDELREDRAVLRIRWVQERDGRQEPHSSPVHCVRMPGGAWKVFEY